VKFPATLIDPLFGPPEPVIFEPGFITKPPVPIFITKPDVQSAVPERVNELQFAGLPFMVIVYPEQMITLSEAFGIVADAVPPQATVDQVAAVFQLPLARE
jgi:hypothetical protein